MTSLHKLIALALVWIVSGGVLAILFTNAALYGMTGTPVAFIATLVLAAAVVATFFITRSIDEPRMKL